MWEIEALQEFACAAAAHVSEQALLAKLQDCNYAIGGEYARIEEDKVLTLLTE